MSFLSYMFIPWTDNNQLTEEVSMSIQKSMEYLSFYISIVQMFFFP